MSFEDALANLKLDDDPTDQHEGQEERPTDNRLEPIQDAHEDSFLPLDDIVEALLDLETNGSDHSGDSEDDPLQEPQDFFGNDPLPEIDLDFGDDNSYLESFLDDPKALESVFDTQSTEESDSQFLQQQDEEDWNHPLPLQPDLNTATTDTWTDSLEPLQDDNLSELLQELPLDSLPTGNDELWWLDTALRDDPVQDWIQAGGGDWLPPYLYCQPCTPATNTRASTPSLPLIHENEPFHDTHTPLTLVGAHSSKDTNDALRSLQLLSMDDETFETTSPTTQEETNMETNTTVPFELQASKRTEALEAAKVFQDLSQRTCLGHKETIFGISFSKCGHYLATASQDTTVRIWHVPTNKLLSTLNDHSNDFECLRVAWASPEWSQTSIQNRTTDHPYLLASGAADGTVKLWSSKNPQETDSWTCLTTLDHGALTSRTDQEDLPQVYALEFIDHWKGLAGNPSFLLTSSDDFLHVWECKSSSMVLEEIMSFHFSSLTHPNGGVRVCQLTVPNSVIPFASPAGATGAPFGGERNPQNLIFAFDASYCAANGLLGVALSDGSLRLLNGRGICVSLLTLPGCQSHLTSFCWDSSGHRLATCVATGHLILWGLDCNEEEERFYPSCAAVLEGGHEHGRPLFGACYCGKDENLILSWGVDGRLCVWDSQSQDQIHVPISTMVDRSSYPIYACAVSSSAVAVSGGSEGGFVGLPFYLYDYA